MKYWRGYLVAAIFAACSWGLQQFAATHATLVDMVYPYVTRLIQDFLAGWSATADFCVWQAVLLVFAAVVLAHTITRSQIVSFRTQARIACLSCLNS